LVESLAGWALTKYVSNFVMLIINK
jgi:hypothetical protein